MDPNEQPILPDCLHSFFAMSPHFWQPILCNDVPFSRLDIVGAWAAGWDLIWMLSLYVRGGGCWGH